jgi:hypothetical protein
LATVRASVRRWLPLASAVVGVVVAHAVDYAVVYPHAADRHHHLLATGHGYWPAATAAAVLAGVTAGAVAVLQGSRRGLRARPAVVDGDLFRAGVGRLAGCQLLLFSIMEVAEHAAAGQGPATLVHRPEFALGLVLQVVVAAAAVVVLTGLERLAERVVGRLARARVPLRRPWLRPPSPPTILAAAVALSARPRGPPRLARP